MSDTITHLSKKISSVEKRHLFNEIKHSLNLNFYGFLLELNFMYSDDLAHYEYYFKYFTEQSFDGKTNLRTIWTAENQPFVEALENPEYIKSIYIILNEEEVFLYDKFKNRSSKPSLIPPLHLSPFNNQHIGFHGAALVRDHKAVLIFGKNNSGKSTCSISLIMNSYRFLSDDLIIYDFKNNQVLAFPRPIGLREGTLKAYPEIKNSLLNKQLIRYKAVDYTHLMVAPEELFPGCTTHLATPIVAIFFRNTPENIEIVVDKVDEHSLVKLLKVFSYSSTLNSNEDNEKIDLLAKRIAKAYIISFNIKLIKMSDLVQIIDGFLANASTKSNT
jgi:outer membrane lipoprotein-sorting protein